MELAHLPTPPTCNLCVLQSCLAQSTSLCLQVLITEARKWTSPCSFLLNAFPLSSCLLVCAQHGLCSNTCSLSLHHHMLASASTETRSALHVSFRQACPCRLWPRTCLLVSQASNICFLQIPSHLLFLSPAPLKANTSTWWVSQVFVCAGIGKSQIFY